MKYCQSLRQTHNEPCEGKQHHCMLLKWATIIPADTRCTRKWAASPRGLKKKQDFRAENPSWTADKCSRCDISEAAEILEQTVLDRSIFLLSCRTSTTAHLSKTSWEPALSICIQKLYYYFKRLLLPKWGVAEMDQQTHKRLCLYLNGWRCYRCNIMPNTLSQNRERYAKVDFAKNLCHVGANTFSASDTIWVTQQSITERQDARCKLCSSDDNKRHRQRRCHCERYPAGME